LVLRVALPLLVLVGCGGSSCRSSSDATPATSAIVVELEGRPNATIDAALLARTPPDFVNEPWRGWKLRTLVAGWDPSFALDIEDDEGFHATIHAAGDDEPVLLLGPGGETRAIRLAPGRAITAHQGDARKDAGRVRHVRVIRARSHAREAEAELAPIALRVVVDGVASTWTREELGRVKPIVLMSKDGDGERQAWPLRELAEALVGAGAVVLEAVGDQGKVLPLAAAKWNDRALVPVLRANRRGRLKLVWLVRATLEEADHEDALRAVTELHVRP
jgi:hypothetical protein